jgi:serine O-acetyltransferase
MKTSIPVDDYVRLLGRRLAAYDDRPPRAPLGQVVAAALERYEYALARIALPGYTRDGEPYFDHLHGDQSAAFWWFAANTAYRRFEDRDLALMFFLLNKAQNGIVAMYDTELPPVFALIHTVGTVLGKAAYGNYFTAYQGVTVGSDRDRSPRLGERVTLLAGSRVIGGAVLGDDVSLAPGALAAHVDVPAGTVLRGSSPDHVLAPRRRDYAALIFRAAPPTPEDRR